jgi:hypothetical protein
MTPSPPDGFQGAILISGTSVYVWQGFASFFTFNTQKLAPRKNKKEQFKKEKKLARQLTRKIWKLTCIVTCEEKKHTSIDTLEIEMACITMHQGTLITIN